MKKLIVGCWLIATSVMASETYIKCISTCASIDMGNAYISNVQVKSARGESVQEAWSRLKRQCLFSSEYTVNELMKIDSISESSNYGYYYYYNNDLEIIYSKDTASEDNCSEFKYSEEPYTGNLPVLG